MSDDRIDGLEDRVVNLEGRMTDVQVTLAKIEGDMRLNNVMTSGIQKTLMEIKDDSSSVVALTKGLNVIGKIIMWGGGLTALIGGLIVIGDWYERKMADALKKPAAIYQSQDDGG